MAKLSINTFIHILWLVALEWHIQVLRLALNEQTNVFDVILVLLKWLVIHIRNDISSKQAIKQED